MQSQTAPIVILAPETNNKVAVYAGKVAIILGSFQAAGGVIAVIINVFLVIPSFRTEFLFGYVGAGFWGGIMVGIGF